MADASLWGNIDVRPVRVGLVFGAENAGEVLNRCFEIATSAWGGMLFPLLPVSDLESSTELADFFDVDVVYSVDEDPSADALSRLTGFRWLVSYNPFDWDDSVSREHTIRMDAIYESFGRHMADGEEPATHVTWDESHPLSSILGAVYGRFGDDDHTGDVAAAFRSLVKTIDVGKDGSLPATGGGNALTATSHEVRVPRAGVGVAAIKPDSPKEVIAYWNHRALGHELIPWPLGYESYAEGLMESWLEGLEGRLPTVLGGQRGLSVWSSDMTVPSELDTLLRNSLPDDGVVVLNELGRYSSVADNDRVARPIHRGRVFDVRVDRDAWDFKLPLPPIEFLRPRDWSDRVGIVTAEIQTRMESDLRPGRRPSAPGLRLFASAMLPWVMSPFIRPAKGGLVMGIHATEQTATVPFVSSLRLLQTALSNRMEVGISDAGRHMSRLVEVLGGAFSDSAANQPAVREVLLSTARSPFGKSVASLVAKANEHRGEWPRHEALDDDYASRVIRWLTSLGALRARVKVRCLSCGTMRAIPPERLADEYSCELCGDSHPLGLILTVQKPAWLLGTPSILPVDRLQETYPAMAALSVFSAMMGPGRHLPHHVFGATFATSGFSCEVDLAVLVHDYERPAVIVGEAKSGGGELDDDDITNLTTVQEAYRDAGIDCQIMYATMREELTHSEASLLREFADSSPMPIRSQPGIGVSPLLPIVLTRSGLSAPSMGEGHPARDAHGSVSRMAIESCKAELGFSGFAFEREGDHTSVLIPTWELE